jgi:RNA polymerase sigma-70 factor (ECF subfamily)
LESEYLSSLKNFIRYGDYITDYLIREKELVNMIEKEVAALLPKVREIFELSRGQPYTQTNCRATKYF